MSEKKDKEKRKEKRELEKNETTVAKIKKVNSDYVGKLEGREIVNKKTGTVIKVRALPSSVYTHVQGLAVDTETGMFNQGDFTRLLAQFGIYEIENLTDENGDPIELARSTKRIMGASTVTYVRSDVLDRMWTGLVNTAGFHVQQLSCMTNEQVLKADFTIR